MKSFFLVGQANVGKTLFLINFAAYLRLSELELELIQPDGSRRQMQLPTERARTLLVGSEPHSTRQLQSITMTLPVRKGNKHFRMIDSTGLSDGIHHSTDVRKGMAQTLRQLSQSELVLHMFDAAEIGKSTSRPAAGSVLNEIDLHIAAYMNRRKSYAILANKMDLPGSKAGMQKLRSLYPQHRIFPISALYSQGFREVKSFVWGLL